MRNVGRSESDQDERGKRFMALYSGHQRRLYLFTTTLLPVAADAEDVLQEANMVLWEKFDQYVPGTSFFAWACRVIRFQVLKYREKQARAARLLNPQVLERLASVAVERIEHLDEFRRRALIDCANQLSHCDRQLIRQRYVEAKSVQAIAAAVDRSPNAVSQSLGRIRKQLLECISRAEQREERDGGRS